MWPQQTFSVSHATESEFSARGLRAFFEYRDLGIEKATCGQFGAHVIRAVPRQESAGNWHQHQLDFQLVYVTRGWVVFEYEDTGEHVLHAGSCVLQPPGVRHRELRHSDDLELLEITSPARFETTPTDAP